MQKNNIAKSYEDKLKDFQKESPEIKKLGFCSVIEELKKIDSEKLYAFKTIFNETFNEYSQNAFKQINFYSKQKKCENLIAIDSIYSYQENIHYVLGICMELADSNLEEEIKKRKIIKNNYTEEEIFQIAKELINGLFFIYYVCKNFHGNIHLRNILIKNNIIKISEPGSVKNFVNNNETTERFPIFGNFEYMPLEFSHNLKYSQGFI